MKMNLKKASMLVTAIETKINELMVPATINVSVFDNVEETISVKREEFLNQMALVVTLSEIRNFLREQIAMKNTESGISVSLTKLATLKRMSSFFTSVIGNGPRVKREILEGKIAKILSSTADASSYGRAMIDVLSTSVLNEADVVLFKKELSTLSKEREKLSESVAKLNLITELEVPVDYVKLLEAEDLV